MVARKSLSWLFPPLLHTDKALGFRTQRRCNKVKTKQQWNTNTSLIQCTHILTHSLHRSHLQQAKLGTNPMTSCEKPHHSIQGLERHLCRLHSFASTIPVPFLYLLKSFYSFKTVKCHHHQNPFSPLIQMKPPTHSALLCPPLLLGDCGNAPHNPLPLRWYHQVVWRSRLWSTPLFSKLRRRRPKCLLPGEWGHQHPQETKVKIQGYW